LPKFTENSRLNTDYQTRFSMHAGVDFLWLLALHLTCIQGATCNLRCGANYPTWDL